MSLFLGVIPLLVIILLVIGAVNTLKPRKKKTFIGAQKIKVILLSYMGLLFMSALLAFILLPSETSGGEMLSKKEVTQIQHSQDKLYESINKSKFNPKELKDSLVKKKTWESPYSNKNLIVAFENEENYNGNLLIEKKNKNDGKIEVAYYRGKSVVDNIDITDMMTSPDFKLKNSKLLITPPPGKQIKLAKFSTGFVFSQFSGRTLFSDESYGSHGSDVIFIKIPKDVDVSGSFYTSVN